MTKNERESAFLTELSEVLLSVKNVEDMKLFLRDILTPSELKEVPKRWQIAKMLMSGKSQREVSKRLGVGIATVTRGARELKDKSGGFWRVLGI